MLPLPFVFLLIENQEDRDFLESLYREHHRLLYYQALQITHSPEAAQDAVSDSILAFTKKIQLLRGMQCNKLKSYLVITVRHCAIDQCNRKKREDVTWAGDFPDLPANERAEDRLLEQAGVENIKQAILRLPPREKDIMLMKYFRELTDEEIAGALGLRPGSVRVHLSRARGHLAQLLQGKGEAE